MRISGSRGTQHRGAPAFVTTCAQVGCSRRPSLPTVPGMPYKRYQGRPESCRICGARDSSRQHHRLPGLVLVLW